MGKRNVLLAGELEGVVDLVRENNHLVLAERLGKGLELLSIVGNASRVVRVVHDHKTTRTVGGVVVLAELVNVFGGKAPSVGELGREASKLLVGDHRARVVGNPAWSRDDNLWRGDKRNRLK